MKNSATSTIEQLSSAIGTLTGQITALQSRADAAFYALLSTDQKTNMIIWGVPAILG